MNGTSPPPRETAGGQAKGRPEGRSIHRTTDRLLENHAAPEAWVPAVTTAANHRGYNNRSSWCHDNRPLGCHYDWTTIRDTSYETKMKAKTTSVPGAGTVSTDE